MPKSPSIQSRSRNATALKATPTTIISRKSVPSTLSALARLPSPSAMEARTEPPIPSMSPKAFCSSMMGKTAESPANASEPTPCPMNMRSTML